ncbi:Ig-like domain repeat protein [Candidatus Poribacteria bacterium]|nr:Ig-like domain repeat protein [Candidatus Poribacteria bacterium]
MKDHSGEGIDTDKSTVRLQGPNGAEIAGRQNVPPQSVGASQPTLTWELNAPPPRDGQADGIYTIRLKVIDKAGNLLETGKTFVYDTLIPRVVSVTANTTPTTPITVEGLEVISRAFTAIAIKLSDVNPLTPPPSPQALGEGQGVRVSGVDLVGTNIRLLAPGNTPIGTNARDDGVDTITISFAQLRQPGTYTLEITPRDQAGNVSGGALQYKFSLDVARPSVSAVTIGGRTAPVTFVNRLDEIVATLVDASGAGLNLTPDGSTIAVTGSKGAVEGIQTSSAPNQIRWTPLHLATDGSADGIYTVTVTPVDSAGRSGTPSRNQVTFDTQQPEVVTVTPINLAQPVSYIGQQITQITAQVADVGPAGLEIANQTIQLRDASGRAIPADLTNDSNNRIFLTLSQPLATNGTNDGQYTVIINLTDKAGNTKRIEHPLVYDTQAPTLVSTDPADGTLRSDDITLITANLADRGGSGIDFAASQLTLLDANGNSISGKRNNDGRGRLTLQINGLTADGNYTIRVLAIDRAGNGANAPFEVRFLFSTSVPVVVSTVPVTTPAEKAFTKVPLRQVEVELQSEGGGPNRSTITLLSPNGTAVPGQQVREQNRLIYRLSRELASDGSDDGTYTVSVTPVNSAGRQGTPQQFTFFYDTVPPEVDTTTIQLIVVNPGVNNSLNEIHAIITDKGPSSRVDWEHIDGTWLTLEKVGTVRKISGTLSSDKQQTLTFRLTTPLASDGSQDGQYRLTLTPKDRAGNIAVGVPGGRSPVQYEFFYDTKPPVIDAASLVIDDQPLLVDTNDPDYPSAASSGGGVVIKAKLTDVSLDGGSGLGADLARSSITLRSPDGNPISGLLKQNGTDGIEFKSGPLTAQGLYQVTITSVGLDSANLGFHPTDSLSTKFLYETTKPTAKLTDFGGNTILEDKPIPLTGTASDPKSGEIPASGVVLVEIVGTGPDGKSIEPVLAKDDSEAKEEPWSRWSLDFLPSRSGEYNLDIRVTDRAGNSAVFDAVTAKFSVSLTFKGPTYVWPNPVRRSNPDPELRIAHFSFDVNVPGGVGAKITLSIYDFAGDLVYESDSRSSNQPLTWDLKNRSGANVARGVYIFRLEAEDTTTNNRTNVVGKILVVE